MNPERVIRGDWDHDRPVMDACLHVWHALINEGLVFDHYSFDQLQNLSREEDKSNVSRALLYLASPRLEVLRTCLMYEFDGNFLELPTEEIVHFFRGDEVIHPELGEPIPPNHILICFTPGRTLLKGAKP